MEKYQQRTKDRKGKIHMRYDTPIFFQHIVRGDYNAETGNYDNEAVTEDKEGFRPLSGFYEFLS